jgi:hypothetical protein
VTGRWRPEGAGRRRTRPKSHRKYQAMYQGDRTHVQSVPPSRT